VLSIAADVPGDSVEEGNRVHFAVCVFVGESGPTISLMVEGGHSFAISSGEEYPHALRDGSKAILIARRGIWS